MSSTRTFTITNNSTSQVQVISADISPSVPEFSATPSETLPYSLDPADSMTVDVIAASASIGASSSNLVITHDGIGSPYSAPLSANFVPAELRPDEITGLTGWWDASQLTLYNDGDPVLQLLDYSGLIRTMNGNVPNPARRPIYRENIQNGLPGIELGPPNPSGTAKYFDQPTFPLFGALTKTLYYVARLNGAAFNGAAGGNLAGTTYLETGFPDEPWLAASAGTNQFVPYGNYTININGGAPTLVAVFGQVAVFKVVRSAAGSDAMLLGDGAGRVPDCFYFEHCTYDRDLTASEDASILAYFFNKWAIS